jgi:hypothetical protein
MGPTLYTLRLFLFSVVFIASHDHSETTAQYPGGLYLTLYMLQQTWVLQIVYEILLCSIKLANGNGNNGIVLKVQTLPIWHANQAQANAQSILILSKPIR